MQNEPTAVWWIRRDLRLHDNQALQAALAHGQRIVPVFVIDPILWQSAYSGPKRLSFLVEGLRQLDTALQKRGGRLILRQGDPLAALSAILEQSAATVIFAEEDVSPYARRRDSRVAEELPLTLLSGLTVQPPDQILKADGTPYTVFTPYSKAWKAAVPPGTSELLPAPEHLLVPDNLHSVPLSTLSNPTQSAEFPPGEEEARQRLRRFSEGAKPPIYDYAQNRNVPALDSTSQLSPYLRFGMLSARRTAVAARQAIEHAPSATARKGAETWLTELIWREFYMSILYHFPRVRQGNFKMKYDPIAWENDPVKLEAWQEGRTGYPIVDAAMRQLQETGWMHNRARMISASFLVKDLLIDWRLGERWFMQHLIDGDPAANNGGWQWTAGTGTDAAPYFRIFNPITQSRKFDPQGAFIRRWLPELANVPDRIIHEPWLMPAETQAAAGCTIGEDYAAPIVDHAAARRRTLAVYKAATS